jgi:histidinol dehydrogenase
MQIIQKPGRSDWAEIIKRPVVDQRKRERSVGKVMEAVRRSGDRAVRKYTTAFDGVRLRRFEATQKEFREAEKMVDEDLKDAIRLAAGNIRRFHEAQRHRDEEVETMPGVLCWRKAVPIERVGLYIPGGSAPLFSTILMLAIPATIAGCREVVLCSPPDATGGLHPALLFAARLTGVHRVFKIGGAQAVAAMAYGTDTVPRVDKIFGPGNAYVTAAKVMAQSEGTAIDMPAGPSEVCILADAHANPAFVASDLLAQAEHGPDSQVLLVSDDEKLISRTLEELKRQVERLPRRTIAEAALQNSRCVLVDSIGEDGVGLVNAYAPEHLIIACSNDERIAEKVTTAGSVFLGAYTPESAGDYASGTNHTLPTNGHARAYSGVSLESFQRKMTFQRISREGLGRIGQAVVTMAEAEGLRAHAEAVRVRLSGNG